jgi:hypothetical protein
VHIFKDKHGCYQPTPQSVKQMFTEILAYVRKG